MKSIQSIISRFYREHSRLRSLRVIALLIAPLPQNLRKNYLFASFKPHKNPTKIAIAFNHPSAASEFDTYFAKESLARLRAIVAGEAEILQKDLGDLSELENITEIRGYLPKNVLSQFDIIPKNAYAKSAAWGESGLQNEEKTAVLCYKERARGDFVVDEKSPFYEDFEKIRAAIKKNLSEENAGLDAGRNAGRSVGRKK